MVVESLTLGEYKSLGIDPKGIHVDDALIMNEIKEMIHENGMAMGFRLQDPDDFLMVDDKAAEDLGIPGVVDLASLKAHITYRLFRQMLINKVMANVLDNVCASYDEGAINDELMVMMAEAEKTAKSEGFTLSFFCDYKGIDGIEGLKDLYRQEIRTSYLEVAVIEAVAEKEGLEISEERFESAVAHYAKSHESDPEDPEAFKKGLLIHDTVNWLVSNNICD